MTTPAAIPWTDARLVALDLEGSGAQDRDNEAILEIAAVPITGGTPDTSGSFATLVNPGRKIRQGPWISPGLTNNVLAQAPPLPEVEPQLAKLVDGATLVGHNIGVDWRLLHRRCPTLQPTGLLDTLRLARHLHPTEKAHSLTKLVDRMEMHETVTTMVPDSQPHRAIWDAVAAALLLDTLLERTGQHDLTLAQVLDIAGLPADTSSPMRLF